MYKERHIDAAIRKADKGFKAVLLTGARQTGKSTLLKHMYDGIPYVTFDDSVVLGETKREPGLFFKNNPLPLVLDEVQYITELFPYIKMQCDGTDINGQLHMTGSQHFHLMKNVSESLAGRIAVLELTGLSLREMNDEEFYDPFIPTGDFIEKRKSTAVLRNDIWDIIHRGSYPGLLDDLVDWEMFYSSYVRTYVDRDINDMSRVKDKLKFTAFMTAIAARTGQMLNYSAVADVAEVSVATVKEWISLLEASGIVFLLQPYSNSVLKRAVKTPKLYFRDTGLVCFLTRHRTADTAKAGAMAGALFETFAVSEILKSFSNAGRDYRFLVTYYRGKDKRGSDRTGDNEIDILIEDGDTIYPVEIKMSANPKLSMTDSFDIVDKIPGKKRGTGVILCRYENPLRLNERTVALPVEYI